ncbi:hypothetical protein ACWJJH_05505 [Endozoicomonadaceae bacterium StTr2]
MVHAVRLGYSTFILITAVLLSALTIAAEPVTVPLVSATFLDDLSPADIRHEYPDGIQIYGNTLSPVLKKQLQDMADSGFQVIFLENDDSVLQQITHDVLASAELEQFLLKVYGTPESSKAFLYDEVLPYCLRRPGYESPRSTQVLVNFQPDVYANDFPRHHLWKNIGFKNENSTDKSVVGWVNEHAEATEHIHDSGFRSCGLVLSREQLRILSRMIALDYLSNAVRGRFYLAKGSEITYYRQLAVETLRPLQSAGNPVESKPADTAEETH